jgi:outer membrane lipopolysaccharide assembly protein LptE/RlpB
MRIAAMLLLVLLAGCGYHTPGTSENWVGGEARIVYVQLFVNQTSDPYLENYLTDAMVAVLSRSRVVRLTENPQLAEVFLAGQVNSFDSSTLAYGETDRITFYRATMSAAAQLVRKGSGEVLWRQSMQRSEDYPATINKNLQLEGERLAARQVAMRLAEDLYASLLNSF